ncbi:MAG: SMP-30/gluconolactonase/LRE family protein [Mycobacterium sp.]
MTMAPKPSGEQTELRISMLTSTHVPEAGAVYVGTERILADGLGFLEGPRWHEGKLWFSDFYSRRVSTVDLYGQLTRRYYVPGQPSGLWPLPDGDILIASTHNARLLRGSANGALRTVADIGAVFRGALNDLVVDGRGRAYLSTLPDLTGARAGDVLHCPIVLVNEHGEARVVTDDLRVPNGMVITGDGRTLIAAETQACRLIKFTIADDGSLGSPEVFVDFRDRKPDGIALDPTGAVWVCCPFSSEVFLVAEGGEVLASLRTPGSWAVACAVGGDGEDTLFVVTAQVTAADLHAGTGTGAVRAYRIARQ